MAPQTESFMTRIIAAALASVSLCLSLTAGAAESALPQRTGRVPLAGLKITERFESQQLTRENFASAVRACLPAYPEAAIERQTREWALPLKNSTRTLRDTTSVGAYVITDSTGVCVHESESGHPVFAAEAFTGTVEPSGVPAAVRDEWFIEIAHVIAAKGHAEIVYKFPNGNAQVALYRAVPPGFTKIEYRAEFRKAGDYDASRYDKTFTHPDLHRVLTFRYGGNMVKPILQHRFPPGMRAGVAI